MVRNDTVIMEHGGQRLKGHVMVPAGQGPFATVLVMHSGLGISKLELERAERLAQRGYLALVTDMYGENADCSTQDSAGQYYGAMMQSPELLRSRVHAWLDAAKGLPGADPERTAAIGYCFGGHCVLELARGGADTKAVVSYHGTLTTHAPIQPGAFNGEVLAFCGDGDPYAPLEDIEALRREFAAAGARYQITTFGGVEHGFTNPESGSLGRPGISYHAMADQMSWAATLAILEIVLDAPGR